MADICSVLLRQHRSTEFVPLAYEDIREINVVPDDTLVLCELLSSLPSSRTFINLIHADEYLNVIASITNVLMVLGYTEQFDEWSFLEVVQRQFRRHWNIIVFCGFPSFRTHRVVGFSNGLGTFSSIWTRSSSNIKISHRTRSVC